KPNGSIFNGLYNPNTENGGLYYYSVDINGCTVQTGVFVQEIQNANPGISTTYLICENYSEFFMTDFLAGTPDYGGVWFNSNAQIMDGFFDPASMDSETFTYMLDNVPGCPPVFSTLTVSENLIPNAGVNTSILVCDNAGPFSMQDQLLGNPVSNGLWFNSLNQPVGDLFDPSAQTAGVYRYFIDAFAPCPDQEAFLTIDFTSTNPSGNPGSVTVCSNGQSIEMIDYLSGNPVDGGIWTNASGQIIDDTYVPSTENPGIYSYYYPNVGCSTTATPLTITEVASPNAGQDATYAFCMGNSSIDLDSYLVGAQLGGSYYSGANSISDQFSLANAGSYVITYQVNSAFCPSDQSLIQITVNTPPPSPNDLVLNYCSTDADVDLANFYPTISNPIWSNPQGIPVVSIMDPSFGDQIIEITSVSGNSCPNASATISVQVDDPYFGDTSVSLNYCQNEIPVDLSDALSSYNLSDGEWTLSNGTPFDGIFNNAIPGDYSYAFVSNQNGACSSNTLTAQVHVDAAVNAGLDNFRAVCVSDDAFDMTTLLSSTATNTSGTWFFNNNFQVGSIFNPMTSSAGDYYYQLPSNGDCPADFAIMTISVDNGFPVNAGVDIQACSGTMPAQIGENPNPTRTYLWSPGIYLSATNVANPFVSFNNTGSSPEEVTYTVEVSNGTCTVYDEILVTINPIPVINAPNSIEVCYGETVNLSASGATNYQWSPANLFDNPLGASQSFEAENSMNITVDAENQYGCEASTEIELEVNPLPVILYDAMPVEACVPYVFQDSLSPDSEHISSFQWQIGNATVAYGSNIDYTLSNDGIFDLTLNATSDFGCTASLSFDDYFIIHPRPFASFRISPGELTTIENTATFTNESIGATQYNWDFGTGDISQEINPIYTYTSTDQATYWVCLESLNDFGCNDTTCRQLLVENEFVFYAPTAFTPDNDGLNDVFKPIFEGFENSTYHFWIYDRWGTVIFETTDADAYWTGNVRGGEYYAPIGSYSWKAQIKVELIADFQEYSGHVVLIR
ncbi:MAG: gliding motility-associated C-terminal domain-containing protein, partial [Flavobacteriales bacterium]